MPRHHCRQKGCPNTYTDVIGGDMAFGKHYAGGDCMPCYYAALFHSYGLTPERAEGSQQLMDTALSHLEKVGWTWDDLKASYQRQPHPVVM